MASIRACNSSAVLTPWWIPERRPTDRGRDARDNGRDPTAIGVMGALHLAQGTLEDMVAVAEAWKAAGATHLAFRTVAAGYARVHEHVELLERFKKMVKGIL